MDDQLQHKRHTLAHLLAAAVLEHYPHAKPTIGPAIETGFYYDFDFSGGNAPGDDDLKLIQKTMRKKLPHWEKFTHRTVSPNEARAYFAGNQYKTELVDELEKEGATITLYTAGDETHEFTDLCRGGHVEHPATEVGTDTFELSSVAGAYWRGDEKNAMLTRIYGIAFGTKTELDAYKLKVEEAKRRDHRKLGKELDLFVFSETVGKGLPLYTPRGSIIRRELEQFIIREELRRGYLHVYTPDIARLDLYKKSGHYPHYKESMYAPITIDDEEFMLRPMTCPHHFELFLSQPRSYRDLPMRIAELAQLYRYEQSGELSGLVRVRTFCLADAHIICTDEAQAIAEIGGALDLIEHVAHTFGLTMGEHYWYRLSLGDRSDTEKYHKNDEAWDTGEALLRDMLKARGCAFVEAAGEAAFYGPKIDIQMKNVNGKEDTAFTVQYDFCMPERFDLTYTARNGNKKRAFVVHRSSIGAIERIMAFLIEHYGGNFPLWLAPEQIRILPVAEVHKEHARKVHKELQAIGIRAELDDSNESLGKRIRNAKKNKLPYFAVIGDKEVEAKNVTLESRSATSRQMSLSALGNHLLAEIEAKTVPAST